MAKKKILGVVPEKKKPHPHKKRTKKKIARKGTNPRPTAAKKAVKAKDKPNPFDPSQKLKDAIEEKFCQQCLVQPNPLRAYLAANEKVTYGSAGTISSRLLKRVDICQRIAFLLQEAADETILSKREALRILTERARADLSDYLVCGQDGVNFLNYGSEVPNTKAVAELTTKTIVTGNGDDAQTALHTKIKLTDGTRAIERLGKMLGWDAAEETNLNVRGSLTVADLVDDASDRRRGLPPDATGEEDPDR